MVQPRLYEKSWYTARHLCCKWSFFFVLVRYIHLGYERFFRQARVTCIWCIPTSWAAVDAKTSRSNVFQSQNFYSKRIRPIKLSESWEPAVPKRPVYSYPIGDVVVPLMCRLTIFQSSFFDVWLFYLVFCDSLSHLSTFPLQLIMRMTASIRLPRLDRRDDGEENGRTVKKFLYKPRPKAQTAVPVLFLISNWT